MLVMFHLRLNNTLSVNNRDWIPYTVESGEVGQFGRPVITLALVGNVVKLVFGSHNILILLKESLRLLKYLGFATLFYALSCKRSTRHLNPSIIDF